VYIHNVQMIVKKPCGHVIPTDGKRFFNKTFSVLCLHRGLKSKVRNLASVCSVLVMFVSSLGTTCTNGGCSREWGVFGFARFFFYIVFIPND
jgi:hypothetical protein